ncbi:FHA domain protein [Duganella sp. CF517]|uniref:type VI secretion system-associated FHA domain protein TagH n=1 Tax=Duganella sp. CF517 TaxID=1881038 RepID=UPI0008BF22FA|nr:type VI secretion system-associated FHA domain protein TagH [Duganella sp. CF517]SEN08342.1 FHA domain protein [Duganella sp. CF517]
MDMNEAAMPQLLLRVERYRDQPPAEPLHASFGLEGGMIGRAPGNVLVLDDPGKYISRSHASVTWRDDRYYLTDAGSNPSIVNGRPLGAGVDIALADGDRIVLGDYVVLASLMAPDVPAQPSADATLMAPPPFVPPPVQAPTPLPTFEPMLPSPSPAPIASEGFDALAGARILDGGAAPAGNDVLADPLGLNLFAGMAPAAVARAAQHDHVSPELQAYPAPSAAPMSIPADYDLLADLQAPAPGAAPPAAAAWSASPAVASPASAQAAPPQPSPPAMHAAPPQQAPVQALPQAAPAPVPRSADGNAVLQALLEGLGLPHLRSSHTPEQLAHLVGEMLRAATAGTMDVLMARTLTKRESHIDMTMIAPRANNPLKFFPDADSALTQMLGAQISGYLPPLPAIGGAFDDLKAHELAVIAGMRAALAAVVQRFDPARIEQRLAEPGRLDKLLPASRKARMWDRLVELYGELARDADDDLQRLFGEKFSGAYAQQVERLRGERPPTHI